eukprot:COSAG05_NODE_139_length_16772_cov_35.582559_12_plen_183_part_00
MKAVLLLIGFAGSYLCVVLARPADPMSFRSALVLITTPYATDGRGQSEGLHQWGCSASHLGSAQRAACGAFYSCALLTFRMMELQQGHPQHDGDSDSGEDGLILPKSVEYQRNWIYSTMTICEHTFVGGDFDLWAPVGTDSEALLGVGFAYHRNMLMSVVEKRRLRISIVALKALAWLLEDD